MTDTGEREEQRLLGLRVAPALLALGPGLPAWTVPGRGVELEPESGLSRVMAVGLLGGLPGVPLGLQR